MTDTTERLLRLEPTILDGVPWWPLRAVCNALRIPSPGTAAALIDPAHKRRVISRPRDWKMKRSVCLIDRQGVERLVIRYGGTTPRRDLLAALDATAGQ